MSRQSHTLARRLSALLFCGVIFALGAWVPSTSAAEPKSEAVRKLEEQLRRATDRIDDLLKEQQKERDESNRLRDLVDAQRKALDEEKKKSAQLLALAEAEAARAARAIDGLKKEIVAGEAARVAEVRARKETEILAAKLAEENKKNLPLVQVEKTRSGGASRRKWAKTAKELEELTKAHENSGRRRRR